MKEVPLEDCLRCSEHDRAYGSSKYGRGHNKEETVKFGCPAANHPPERAKPCCNASGGTEAEGTPNESSPKGILEIDVGFVATPARSTSKEAKAGEREQ